MGLLDKVKAQATVLADKAQTGVQRAKTKLQEMQAGKQADHLLRELGAYVFLSERGRGQADAEGKVAGIMGQLDSLEAAGTPVTVTPDPTPVPPGGAVPQSAPPAAPAAGGARPLVGDPVPQADSSPPPAGGTIPTSSDRRPGEWEQTGRLAAPCLGRPGRTLVLGLGGRRAHDPASCPYTPRGSPSPSSTTLTGPNAAAVIRSVTRSTWSAPTSKASQGPGFSQRSAPPNDRPDEFEPTHTAVQGQPGLEALDVPGEEVQGVGRDIGQDPCHDIDLRFELYGEGASRGLPRTRSPRFGGRGGSPRIDLGGHDRGAGTDRLHDHGHGSGARTQVDTTTIGRQQSAGQGGQRFGLPTGHVDPGIDGDEQSTEGRPPCDPRQRLTGPATLHPLDELVFVPAAAISSSASSLAATQPAASRVRVIAARSKGGSTLA